MGVRITDTTLRDAHQSLLATRMRTEDMLPIAPLMDEVGFHSVEVWGGATFDTCLRFLREDPWERLRQLKKAFRRTPLQMLLRGQNVVGYRHYADDVVEKFVELAAKNGIDIFRIFDAVNDLRNLETAVRAAKRVGAHVQGAICYTISPVHTLDLYARLARQLEEMGCDSICIKDMAGLLHPYDGYELVRRLKETVRVPIQLHAHCTAGLAPMTVLKAIEAGVDVVDCAVSSMALGTSQPPCEPLVATLRGTHYDPGLDLELLSRISDYFAQVREKYAAFEGGVMVDVGVLVHQVPGGMVSNLVSQLRELGAADRLKEVLAEIPRVRADLGYPPLVTPTSQIVGIQAVLNVLAGQRYKQVTKETRAYVQGYYGAPPGPVHPEVKAQVLGDAQEIVGRPADHIPPELEKARQEIGHLAQSEEDVVSYVLFPQVAREFFEWRARGSPLEEEVVAAIAAALVQHGPPPAPAAPTHPPSWWKMAGRQRLLHRMGTP
ncbi:MAG: pyruvate/oxaloacetate carboxyltransferase [Dehalococcoidia bacterium]|jgi:pyruvate carboxylase subunit B|nr:pyruvate/oxaloacetate carboxyltransferase [Dehalococcoidia bacterium]